MKFVGIVGFWIEDEETEPGVYNSKIIEKTYKGDVVVDSRRNIDGEFKINNRISILADMYMLDNWPTIKYVIWNKHKLRVTSITLNERRVTVEIGGTYDGATENETT